MGSFFTRFVKVLDARKRLIVLNSFYNSLSGKPQHLSVAGNGHYLLFIHTANIGIGLQLTIIYPKKTKEENKREERTDRREEATTPRPLAYLPAAPLPPQWIRQSTARPCSATSRDTLTRQETEVNPPPPAAANDQHINKAKAKKMRPPACINPQPHATDTRAPRGCPLQERARSKNPHHRNSGG